MASGFAGFRERLRHPRHLRQQPDQLPPLGLVLVGFAAQRQRVAARQRRERIGQPVGRRNRGVVEQDGDDLLALFECQRDFPADEIIRVVQAPAAVVAADIQPFRSDQRQQSGAPLDAPAQLVRKHIAALDRASVEKDAIVAEASAQIFMQGAAVSAGVAAAVADEDRRLVRHQKRSPW
jgi:hypothetical protein